MTTGTTPRERSASSPAATASPDGIEVGALEDRPSPAGAALEGAVEEHHLRSIVLVRHGATQWSRSGRHTGRTDLPLDEGGREQAAAVGRRLADRHFGLVWSSPRQRALETCRLVGYAERAEVVDDLQEWSYGAYEGLTTAQIRAERPGWQVFLDGCPEGETPGQVAARADRVLVGLRAEAESRNLETAIVFSHGHFLRTLAARWLGLEAAAGRFFALEAGRVSELGFEREVPVLASWNC